MKTNNLSDKVIEINQQELILMRHCLGQVAVFGSSFLKETLTEDDFYFLRNELQENLDKLNIDIW